MALPGEAAAERLLAAARARGLRLVTAESCTGGMIAAALTAIAGSSDVFDRGFVTYSDGAKTEMLGVPAALIGTHGAVSEDVALAMAVGALARSQADFAVAVTGGAGPGGGTAAKPVGRGWFALAGGGVRRAERRFFPGDRAGVRAATVEEALALLAAALG